MTYCSEFWNPLIRVADRFDNLVTRAQACRACASMDGQLRILSRKNGSVSADIMLIGEAPGRLGAGQSGVPFSGDESRRRLDRLIDAAGWNREMIFITNAVLCNPLDEAGRNRPPRATELGNCRSWMLDQIDLIQPRLVVCLGAVALRAAGHIEAHERTLQDSDRPPIRWYGRHLAGVYHPGARAAVHRNVAAQIEDFQMLSRWYAKQIG